MKKFQPTFFLVTAVAAAMVFMAWQVLFRHSTNENPALGTITTVYRWGRPKSVLVDANRDGVVDAKARFRLAAGEQISPHTDPEEIWESMYCDGILDLHAVIGAQGQLSFLEIDADRDGRYEKRLDTEAAASFWRELRRPPECVGGFKY